MLPSPCTSLSFLLFYSRFENLVFEPGTTSGNNVAPLPYVIQPRSAPSGIKIFYPTLNVSKSASTISNVNDRGVSLGSVEEVSGGPYVTSFDQLTAYVKFKLSDTQSMQSPVVRGMAFASMQYTHLTPRVDISSEVPKSIHVDGTSIALPCSKVMGSNFLFKLAGTDESWKLYSSSPISFKCDYSKANHFTLLASSTSSSTLRFALTNNCTYGIPDNSNCGDFTHEGKKGDLKAGPRDSTKYEALLDQHWQTMPIGATWKTQVNGDVGSVMFGFDTVDVSSNSGNDNASVPLLHTALAHHVLLFDEQTKAGVVSQGVVWGHRNLRGRLPTSPWP